MSGPPNGGSRGFKRGGRGSGGNVKTDAPSASPAPKPRAPRAGGGSPAPKPRAQSVHHFAASREVTPPAQLANWLSTPEGRDAVVSAAIGVGDVVFGATTIVLHGEYPEEVDRAALLVEAVFDHRVRLHSRLAVKDRLDAERAKIQAELDAGLRVEFSVQPHLMGMIVGVQGVRIKSVSDQCDIDRVVVDRDLHVIRIVGKYPAEVRKARQMLELRVETVEAKDDRTRRILIGKGGVTINDVQRRSGAMSIDVDHERGVVKILGTASAAAAAKVLMEMHIATLNDLDAAADDLEELRGGCNDSTRRGERSRTTRASGEGTTVEGVGGGSEVGAEVRSGARGTRARRGRSVVPRAEAESDRVPRRNPNPRKEGKRPRRRQRRRQRRSRRRQRRSRRRQRRSRRRQRRSRRRQRRPSRRPCPRPRRSRRRSGRLERKSRRPRRRRRRRRTRRRQRVRSNSARREPGVAGERRGRGANVVADGGSGVAA